MIYALWFGETRMEVFKIVQGVYPFVRPKIEQLRAEIYQFDFHHMEHGDLVVDNRTLGPEVVDGTKMELFKIKEGISSSM